MNKHVLAATALTVLSMPVMAQSATENATLDQVRQEIEVLKQQNERLSAEVDYLKTNAKETRKSAAEEELTLNKVGKEVSKFKWSGDFRYRNEQIEAPSSTTAQKHTQSRDRMRLRFGVKAKVNDTISAKIQLATSGGGVDPRSTNQTLTETWSRKAVGIDQAYVDWQVSNLFNIQLGKMPMPWKRTGSYFWDGDLTPEGAALKFVRGPLFATASYDWLAERNGSSTVSRADPKLLAAQVGYKWSLGGSSLTGALGYFDVTHVQNQIVTASTTPVCTANAVFLGSAQGNSTIVDGDGCTVLQSDFSVLQALVQFDATVGALPLNAFVDYMQNTAAEVNTIANTKLDTAWSVGATLNKAKAVHSWEVGLVYQQAEKDAVFGQFHDSDFGGGVTDTKGYVLKAAWVPASNWVMSAAYIKNKRFNDAPTSSTTQDVDYKRLQLDLNYKF